ncbi:hypothetical protein CEXT_296991 [Caerostris extrusa]|uniref:Uncharacterized protein n=1 Tax=Caerostris extrusa TaxID=172846 RepID=A0AAV4NUH2_CAEEX|nr:hypothetical protein CEXT_296991 [Caerostris extrusa]
MTSRCSCVVCLSPLLDVRFDWRVLLAEPWRDVIRDSCTLDIILFFKTDLHFLLQRAKTTKTKYHVPSQCNDFNGLKVANSRDREREREDLESGDPAKAGAEGVPWRLVAMETGSIGVVSCFGM